MCVYVRERSSEIEKKARQALRREEQPGGTVAAEWVRRTAA